MRISLGNSYKLSMGNYESLEISTHVTLEDDDFDEGELDDMTRDERAAFLTTEAKKYMDDYLDPELRAAAVLSQATASMLIDPDPAPRRTERTTRRRST